jgi:predicted RNA-binding protein with PIN domain
LRPALEAAVAVARAGEDDIPVQAAPSALRPFLNFTKLPARALVAARRTLDGDEDFRARVASEVSEESVGRAGWLFLTRPDGWQADLDALAQQHERKRAGVADHRAEDSARRRLGTAEGIARRAEAAAASARAEAAQATAALAEERRARRAAAGDVVELTARVETLAAERDAAVAEAASARSAVTAARAESAAARTAEQVARVEAARAREEAAAATAAAADARAQLAAAGARRRGPAPVATPAPAPAPAPERGAPAGQQGGEALATAATAARALADALAAAGRALAADQRPGPASPPPPVGGETVVGRARPSRPPGPRRARPPSRVAVPLPPAVFEDSAEAAEHLARLPGVVILVDGYNVSHAGWPGVPIAEQRRRLVDALTELVARTGADVRVVFDGGELAQPPPVATTARRVRVTFSPPDVEADDVIVAEVGEIPAHRPVVVASSDRRVGDESRARGANVVRSHQLLVLLRR